MPLASDRVACDPGVVADRNFWFVPDVAIEPTVFVVPDLSCNVPLVIVKALVEPSVRASCIAHVPPIPSKVMALLMVTLLVVIVWAVVAAKVKVFVPLVTVMPVDNTKSP